LSMYRPEAHRDTKEFLLSYLMRNNVELDILRIIFSANLVDERPNFKYLKDRSVFEFINLDLIQKLKNFGFIGEENGYFLRYRGYHAILYFISEIVQTLCEKTCENEELVKTFYDEGFCLGGSSKDSALHAKLLHAFLEDLTRLNLLKCEGSKYSASEEEERCKFACCCMSKLIVMGSLRSRSELEETIDFMSGSLSLEKLSIGYLMEKLTGSTLTRAKAILSSSASSDRFFSDILKMKQKSAISEKDWVASAAYWQLEAAAYEEERDLEKFDFCKSRSFISLAIFWKRSKDLGRAAKYYERASEIMAKYPGYSRNATLQLANSLMCKGKKAELEENFSEGSVFYTKASELFAKLGMNKESIFCEFRNLECQAHENAAREEFLVSSEFMNKAASIMKGVIDNYYWSCLASAKVFEARHLERVDEFAAAAKCQLEASEFYEKADLPIPSFRSRAHSFQSKAFALKNSKAPYSEIAKACLEASAYYVKSHSFEAAKVCEADSLKYQGLDALGKAEWTNAISFSNQGKMAYRELVFYCDDPRSGASYRNGETWFEAMRVEVIADQKLLAAINKKEDLSEVEKLLAHAADLFTRVGDYKHAEIDSSLIFITSAIDAFHKGNVAKANSLIEEAKQRLPPDFVFSILEDKVKQEWQPLRYTVEIMKDFDTYARKIESEKGFSFESRMRELIKKMHSEYHAIEPKSFKPEKDEIGVVFKDETPVEIDAVGTRESADNMFLLVSEMKNISNQIGKQDVELFLKKVEFIEKRYSKIAKLQGLKKAMIENKLIMSTSNFDLDAKSRAEKNNIKIYEKSEINKLLQKHHMFRIPE
jgi:hypothetical protein